MKHVLTVGPDIEDRGGMAGVLRLYRDYVFPEGAFRYLPTNSRRGKIHGFVALLSSMAHFLSERFKGYTLIHVHCSTGKSFYRKLFVSVWASFLGYRIIIHWHGGRAPHFFRNRINKLFLKLFSRISCAWITTSQSWVEYFSGVVPMFKLWVVHNPSIIPVSTPLPHDEINFLFLARIRPDKGIYGLLDALVKYKNIDRKWKLIIAGDGDIKLLESEVSKRGLSNSIEIKGWVDGDMKQMIIANSDVLVNPSYAEAAPLCILECMAAGKAVIATDVGSVNEIVEDGGNGFLFSPGDIGQLQNLLGKYLYNRSLIERHGQRSKELSANYSGQIVRQQLMQVYSSLGDLKL